MDEMTNGFESDGAAHEQITESLLAELPPAIGYSCWKHHGQIPADEQTDLRQQIFLHLIEDDCRRLRLYDQSKASFKTWLHTVVEHEVSHYLHRRKNAECLDELAPETFAYQASQEDRVLLRERKNKLRVILKQLTEHEQQLLELVLDDSLSTKERAASLGIKPASLRREKHALLKKVRKLLGGGNKAGWRRMKKFAKGHQRFWITSL
jgi:RNA polymerase sigma factor (sigma-70 family)